VAAVVAVVEPAKALAVMGVAVLLLDQALVVQVVQPILAVAAEQVMYTLFILATVALAL
jgi:hypothetical protein